MDIDVRAINEKIERESAFLDILTLEMNKVIVGQKQMIESLLIGLLGNGHILLEGVPGLAKTLAINTLSKAVQGSFSRVQFTPDLLPADVVGTMIYNMKENDFAIKKGPPPRRGGMRGVVHLCGHRWMGDWEPVTDSLRGHDTLKAGDVLAEPLTGAQC